MVTSRSVFWGEDRTWVESGRTRTAIVRHRPTATRPWHPCCRRRGLGLVAALAVGRVRCSGRLPGLDSTHHHEVVVSTAPEPGAELERWHGGYVAALAPVEAAWLDLLQTSSARHRPARFEAQCRALSRAARASSTVTSPAPPRRSPCSICYLKRLLSHLDRAAIACRGQRALQRHLPARGGAADPGRHSRAARTPSPGDQSDADREPSP